MKSLRASLTCCLLVGAWVAACGPKRIPEGTPPPEYERPVVTPWPPADAQAEASAEADVSAPEGTSGQPELDGDVAPERGDAGALTDGVPTASDAGAIDAAPLLPSDAGPKR